jgi:hypothetical protein
VGAFVNLIEKKARGTSAQNLLSDDVLKDALRELSYAAHRAFESAATPEDRERAWQQLDAGNRFARYLRALVEQGRQAAVTIEKELRQPTPARDGFLRRARARVPEVDMPWHSRS